MGAGFYAGGVADALNSLFAVSSVEQDYDGYPILSQTARR